MTQQQQHLRLRRDPTEAARARQQIAAFCAEMTTDARVTAELLTSELVTNAINHGTGAISVRLTGTRTALRVEVADESADAAVVQDGNIERPSGRGLLLIEALATAWGVNPRPGGPGKTVWFTLEDGRPH